jgi:hypothetical protein
LRVRTILRERSGEQANQLEAGASQVRPIWALLGLSELIIDEAKALLQVERVVSEPVAFAMPELSDVGEER